MAVTRNARAAWTLLGAVAASLLYGTFASGAQAPPGQTWTLLALALTATVAVVAWLYGNELALRTSRLAVCGVAGVAGFALWAAAGIPASVTPDRSWATANVVLGYALAVVLGMLLGSSLPRAARRVGVVLGVVMTVAALYALAGKTIPAVLDTSGQLGRLQAPLDYWNALALCCVSGMLPLLRAAADPELRVPGRLASLLGVYVLAVVLGLTYSRGGLFALGAGVLVFAVLTTERVRTLVLLAAVVAAAAAPIALVTNSPALSANFASVASRVDDARTVLIATLGCGVLLALVGRAAIVLETRATLSRERARATLRAVTLAVLVVAVSFVASGGLGRAWHSFTDIDKPNDVFTANRVLSLNSGTRWTWWKEAAGAFSDKPATGWGAGSFAVTHLLYRKLGFRVQQPHSVPLEWLAEDGVVGLLLAAGGLLALLAAALSRVRSTTGSERGAQAALFAVAVAWVAQSPFEWTWDIPAATLPMLLALGVLAGRPAPPRRIAARGAAVVGAAAAFVLLATSLALPELSRHLAGSAEDTAGRDGVTSGALARAARQADLAARLDPVATDALRTAADVAERRGRRAQARAYLLRAVRRQPYDLASWDQLARLELADGDRPDLLRALAQRVRLDPINLPVLGQAEKGFAGAVGPGESASATGSPLPPATP